MGLYSGSALTYSNVNTIAGSTVVSASSKLIKESALPSSIYYSRTATTNKIAIYDYAYSASRTITYKTRIYTDHAVASCQLTFNGSTVSSSNYYINGSFGSSGYANLQKYWNAFGASTTDYSTTESRTQTVNSTTTANLSDSFYVYCTAWPRNGGYLMETMEATVTSGSLVLANTSTNAKTYLDSSSNGTKSYTLSFNHGKLHTKTYTITGTIYFHGTYSSSGGGSSSATAVSLIGEWD